ncbi:ribbon-helix-helix domain-containing protein [Sandarakinorhabdus sp.]|uniref:ribbon-helix-helix domain-containing protein n=1 Tax=Sandarakinorhabdus sp. TaxID=1916663 RepID=UPI003F6F2ACA
MDEPPTRLAEPAREWIASQVASGAWPNETAYLNDLVARDRDEAERLAFVRTAIAEARASGPSKRTLDDIIAEGRQRHAGG